MAEHRFTLPGTTAPEIVVRTKTLGFPAVLVDGVPVEREVRGGRSFWPIATPTGTRQLMLRGALTGLQGAVDGELIRIERRLAPWELALSLAPLTLAALGVIPGLVGLVAALAALRLVRLPSSAAGRIGILIANLAVAVGLGYALYLTIWS